jgi:iron uptake system component EfeO
MKRITAATAISALVFAGLAGCTDKESSESGASTKIDVVSSDDACTLSATEAAAGTIVFTVKNDGGNVTEFYMLEEDGETIVNEVEDIGPVLSRDMTVKVEAGKYVTKCDPSGGEEIKGSFTVK